MIKTAVLRWACAPICVFAFAVWGFFWWRDYSLRRKSEAFGNEFASTLTEGPAKEGLSKAIAAQEETGKGRLLGESGLAAMFAVVDGNHRAPDQKGASLAVGIALDVIESDISREDAADRQHALSETAVRLENPEFAKTEYITVELLRILIRYNSPDQRQLLTKFSNDPRPAVQKVLANYIH